MQSRTQIILLGAKLVAVGAAATSLGPTVLARRSVGRMTVSVGVPVTPVRGDVYYWGSPMAARLITSVRES